MARQSFVTDEVLRNIKHIEIHTRRLLRGMQVGDTRSALKGTGFEFDQIRDYHVGDDVRFIDWNASARMDSLLVKQYIEERSRLVLLAVDISGSMQFGSGTSLKRTTIAQIASVLALVTDAGKDRVGLILFSDDIEAYIPPGRGRFHVQRIMEYAFGFQPCNAGTNVGIAFKKLAQLKRKDAVVFVISDFIDQKNDQTYFPLVSKLYDVTAIRCLDQREHELPQIGFVRVQDSETNEELILDMRRSGHIRLDHFLKARIAEQNKTFKRYGIKTVDVKNDASFIGDLIMFFRQRMRY